MSAPKLVESGPVSTLAVAGCETCPFVDRDDRGRYLTCSLNRARGVLLSGVPPVWCTLRGGLLVVLR